MFYVVVNQIRTSLLIVLMTVINQRILLFIGWKRLTILPTAILATTLMGCPSKPPSAQHPVNPTGIEQVNPETKTHSVIPMEKGEREALKEVYSLFEIWRLRESFQRHVDRHKKKIDEGEVKLFDILTQKINSRSITLRQSSSGDNLANHNLTSSETAIGSIPDESRRDLGVIVHYAVPADCPIRSEIHDQFNGDNPDLKAFVHNFRKEFGSETAAIVGKSKNDDSSLNARTNAIGDGYFIALADWVLLKKPTKNSHWKELYADFYEAYMNTFQQRSGFRNEVSKRMTSICESKRKGKTTKIWTTGDVLLDRIIDHNFEEVWGKCAGAEIDDRIACFLRYQSYAISEVIDAVEHTYDTINSIDPNLARLFAPIESDGNWDNSVETSNLPEFIRSFNFTVDDCDKLSPFLSPTDMQNLKACCEAQSFNRSNSNAYKAFEAGMKQDAFHIACGKTFPLRIEVGVSPASFGVKFFSDSESEQEFPNKLPSKIDGTEPGLVGQLVYRSAREANWQKTPVFLNIPLSKIPDSDQRRNETEEFGITFNQSFLIPNLDANDARHNLALQNLLPLLEGKATHINLLNKILTAGPISCEWISNDEPMPGIRFQTPLKSLSIEYGFDSTHRGITPEAQLKGSLEIIVKNWFENFEEEAPQLLRDAGFDCLVKNSSDELEFLIRKIEENEKRAAQMIRHDFARVLVVSSRTWGKNAKLEADIAFAGLDGQNPRFSLLLRDSDLPWLANLQLNELPADLSNLSLVKSIFGNKEVHKPRLQGRFFDGKLQLKIRGGADLFGPEKRVDIDTGWLEVTEREGTLGFELPSDSDLASGAIDTSLVRFPSGLSPRITRELNQIGDDQTLSLRMAVPNLANDSVLIAFGKINLSSGSIELIEPNSYQLEQLKSTFIPAWSDSFEKASAIFPDLLYGKDRDNEQLTLHWVGDQFFWRDQGKKIDLESLIDKKWKQALEKKQDNFLIKLFNLEGDGFTEKTSLRIIPSQRVNTLSLTGTCEISKNGNLVSKSVIKNLEVQCDELQEIEGELSEAILAESLEVEVADPTQLLNQFASSPLGLFEVRTQSLRYKNESWHLEAELFFDGELVSDSSKMSFRELKDLRVETFKQIIGDKRTIRLEQATLKLEAREEDFRKYAFSVEKPSFHPVTGTMWINDAGTSITFDRIPESPWQMFDGVKLEISQDGHVTFDNEELLKKQLSDQLEEKIIQVVNRYFSEVEEDNSRASFLKIDKLQLTSLSLLDFDFKVDVKASLAPNDLGLNIKKGAVSISARVSPQGVFLDDLGAKLEIPGDIRITLLNSLCTLLEDYADENGNVLKSDFQFALSKFETVPIGELSIRLRDVQIVEAASPDPIVLDINTKQLVDAKEILFNMAIEQGGQVVEVRTETNDQGTRAFKLTKSDLSVNRSAHLSFSGNSNAKDQLKIFDEIDIDQSVVDIRIKADPEIEKWISADEKISFDVEAFINCERLEPFVQMLRGSRHQNEQQLIKSVQLNNQSVAQEVLIATGKVDISLIDGLQLNVFPTNSAEKLSVIFNESVANLGFANLTQLVCNFTSGEITATGGLSIPGFCEIGSVNLHGLKFHQSGLDISNVTIDEDFDLSGCKLLDSGFEFISVNLDRATPKSVSGTIKLNLQPLIEEDIQFDLTLQWTSGGLRIQLDGDDIYFDASDSDEIKQKFAEKIVEKLIELANQKLDEYLPASLGQFELQSVQLASTGENSGLSISLSSVAAFPDLGLEGLSIDLNFKDEKWTVATDHDELQKLIENRVRGFLIEKLSDDLPINNVSAMGYTLSLEKVNADENLIAFEPGSFKATPNVKLVLNSTDSATKNGDDCQFSNVEIARLDSTWQIKLNKQNINNLLIKCLASEIEIDPKELKFGKNSLLLVMVPELEADVSEATASLNVFLKGKIDNSNNPPVISAPKCELVKQTNGDEKNKIEEVDEAVLFEVSGIGLTLPLDEILELKDFGELFKCISWKNAKVKNGQVLPYLLMPDLQDWLDIETASVQNELLDLSGRITLPGQTEEHYFNISVPLNGSRDTFLLSLLDKALAVLKGQSIEHGGWALEIVDVSIPTMDVGNGPDNLKVKLSINVHSEWDGTPFTIPVTLTCSQEGIELAPIKEAIEDFIISKMQNLYASFPPVSVKIHDGSGLEDGFYFDVSIKVYELFEIEGKGFHFQRSRLVPAKSWKLVNQHAEIKIPPLSIYDLGVELRLPSSGQSAVSPESVTLIFDGKVTAIKKESGKLVHLDGERSVKFETDRTQLKKITYGIHDKLVFLNFLSQFESEGELTIDFSTGRLSGTQEITTKEPLKGLVDVDGEIDVTADSHELIGQGTVEVEAFGFSRQDATFHMLVNDKGEFSLSLKSDQEIPIIKTSMEIFVDPKGMYLEQSGNLKVAGCDVKLKVNLSTFSSSYLEASVPKLKVSKRFPIPNPNDAAVGLKASEAEMRSWVASLLPPKLPDSLDPRWPPKKRKKGSGPGEKPKKHHPGPENEAPKPGNGAPPPNGGTGSPAASQLLASQPPEHEEWPIPISDSDGASRFRGRVIQVENGEYQVQVWDQARSSTTWTPYGHIVEWRDASLNLPPKDMDSWVKNRLSYIEVREKNGHPSAMIITFTGGQNTKDSPIDLDGKYEIVLPKEPSDKTELYAVKNVEDEKDKPFSSIDAWLLTASHPKVQPGQSSSPFNGNDFVLRYRIGFENDDDLVYLKMMQVANNTRRIKEGSQYFKVNRNDDTVVGSSRIDKILSWKPLASDADSESVATNISEASSLFVETSPNDSDYDDGNRRQRGWLWRVSPQLGSESDKVALLSNPFALHNNPNFDMEKFRVNVEIESNGKLVVTGQYGTAVEEQKVIGKQDSSYQDIIKGIVREANVPEKDMKNITFMFNEDGRNPFKCPRN